MNIQASSNLDFYTLSNELKQGKILVYPTETCYGLGCDASNVESVEKVFEIKGRPKEKPCILLFKDIEMLRQYVFLDQKSEHLVKKYWPGPLTVLLEVQKTNFFSPVLIPSTGKVSCRISPHPFLEKLFTFFDRPLVSTSANLAGMENIYRSDEIIHTFSSRIVAPDIFVDAGDLPLNPPSTIIEIKDGALKIHRQGSIHVS